MSLSFFPFERLGFHGNPFRTLTHEEWAAIAVIPPHFDYNIAPYIQILGEKGRGKSTLLHHLTTVLAAPVIYEYLPEGQSRYKSTLSDTQWFLLDEAQRLQPRQRHRLCQTLIQHPELRLIFSSHEDLTPTFQKWKLPLHTDELNRSSPDHLQRMIERRLDYFAIITPTNFRFEREAVEYLYQTFGSNHRAIEFFLYEYFQVLITQPPMTVITATQLAAQADFLLAKIPPLVRSDAG